MGSITDQPRALLDRGNRRWHQRYANGCSWRRPAIPSRCWSFPLALSDTQLAGRAPLPDAMPLTSRLQAAFKRRVERLPDSTQAALLLAAAESGGEPRSSSRHGAAHGPAARCARPGGACRADRVDAETLDFRHPLVRSAIHDSATFAARNALTPRWPKPVGRPSTPTVGSGTGQRRRSGQRGHCGRTRGVRGALGDARRARVCGDRIRACRQAQRDDPARGRRLGAAARTALAAGQVGRAGDLVGRALPPASRADRARLLGLGAIIESFAGSLADADPTLLEGIAAAVTRR